MNFTSRLDLRARLVWLLLGAFSILFLLPVLNYVYERDQGMEAAKADLLGRITGIATSQAYLLGRGEAILNSLANSPELGPHASTQVCQQYLATRLAQDSVFSQMTKVRPNGDIACAAVPPAGYFNIASRPYFQRTLKSSEMEISEVVTGQIFNKPIIIFSKSVRDSQNVVTGVVLLALGLNWMEKAIASSPMPEGARISVMDAKGDLVARHPDPEAWTGKSASLSPAIRRLLQDPVAGVFEDVARDGTLKLFAHAPLLVTAAGSQYQLVLSIPTQVIDAPIRREALIAMGVMLVVLVGTIAAVLVGGHYMLMQPLRRLTEAAARFKLGDFSARSGLPHGRDTLGRLAETLDESADAIAAHDRQLLANETRYRTLVEMAPDAVVVHREGSVIYVNPAAVLLFAAASDADLVGRSVMDFIDPQFHDMAQARFTHVAQLGGSVPRVRQTLLRRNGSAMEVEVQSVAILFNDAPAIQIHIYDLTERLRREHEMLRLRDEMQSMMEWQVARHTVAALAHEINQPLASLAALSEAARRMAMGGGLTADRSTPLAQQLDAALVLMGQEAERAGLVLRNLLQTVHQRETALEPVNLSDLLHTTRQAYLLNHGDDCDIVLSCQADLPPIRLNRLQLSKVLLNLIGNSGQAMRSANVVRGRIWLTAERAADGKTVVLSVQDEGPGIEAQVQHQMFHPFFTTKPDGLGMGLAICRTLIELHGGRLWCESQPASGALLRFTLPVSRANT
jgi:PAS domain S-box-containing protein